MKTPDWSEWGLMPKVELWQAVALSMNLEPHALSKDVHTPLLGFGSFFKPNSFPSSAIEREFEKRLRILGGNLENSEQFSDAIVNDGELRLSIVALPEFSAWAVSVGWEIPEELAKKSAEADEVDRVTSNCKDMEIKHAALFDYVSPEQLERMFPSGGHWKDWTRKAKAQGLDVARREKKYNPYLAARWWIDKHPKDDWDWGRVARVLVNNFPPRSVGSGYLLGVENVE